MVRSLRALCSKVLPEPPPHWTASAIYTSVLSRVRTGHAASRAASPWFLRQKAIEQFHRRWSTQWIFSVCDKNTGKLSAHCRIGKLRQELKELDDARQFTVVHVAPSSQEAKADALHVLHKQAKRFGQKKFWVTGPSRSPPIVSFGMQRSRAWCGTPPILGVVNMVGTRNFTCYMGAL